MFCRTTMDQLYSRITTGVLLPGSLIDAHWGHVSASPTCTPSFFYEARHARTPGIDMLKVSKHISGALVHIFAFFLFITVCLWKRATCISFPIYGAVCMRLPADYSLFS